MLPRNSCILLIGCLCFLLGQGTLAQGHCAKVSERVTLFFDIDTPLLDANEFVSLDLLHTEFDMSFRRSGWDVALLYGDAVLSWSETLLIANENARWVLSAIPPGFEFIGAKPGEPFWILPQNIQAGVLSLGLTTRRVDTDRLCPWNPNDPRGADTNGLWFELRLLDVRGPADANFAMWQADGINPPVVFMSTHNDGITDDDVLYLTAGGHTHVNWGFTKAGRYEIDFRVSTVLRIDDELTADWAPPGDGSYYGDGHVDFQDFAWMAAHWMQTPFEEDPNTFMFVDPNDPNDPVNTHELEQLVNQWLLCGYPGCTMIDANEIDPNE